MGRGCKEVRQLRYAVFGWVLVLLAAVAVPASPAAAAYDSSLKRYPYLTDLVGSAATVNFATDRSHTHAQVRWARVGQESCASPPHPVPATRRSITVDGVPEFQWKALLDLAPEAEYCYRVYFGSGSSPVDLLDTDPSPHFTTQIASGSPQAFSFAVFVALRPGDVQLPRFRSDRASERISPTAMRS